MVETACCIPVHRPRGAGFRACGAILSLALFSTGCGLFHTKKQQARVFVPPPPPPSKPVNLKLPPVLDPPDLVVETVDASNELAFIGSGFAEFPPPRPAPAAPRRPPAVKPAVAPPAAIETPATPRIAQIFTPEQLRENNRILDDSLERVQRALETLGKRNLNAEQRDRMGQIRELQMQARQMREEDLEAAVSLARHADLLAKDLLDHLP
jgi:hypothetical protein